MSLLLLPLAVPSSNAAHILLQIADLNQTLDALENKVPSLQYFSMLGVMSFPNMHPP